MRKTPPTSRPLVVVCLVLIITGIALRFANIDSKPIWCDEALTLVSIKTGDGPAAIPSQMTTAGAVADLVTIRKPLDAPFFFEQVKFQRAPNTPLYFFAARLWAECFGNTIHSARTLAAMISLLQLPCVFWLCIELLGCATTAWVCTAVLALSPLHLVYAQEARPYSSWTLTILLGTVLLARAWRKNNVSSWLAYSLSLVVGFYTHPASVILAATNAVATLLESRKKFVPFLVAATAAMLACLPWVLGTDPARVHRRTFDTWSSAPTDFFELLRGWISATALGFLDCNNASESCADVAARCILAAVGAFSIWYASRKASHPARLLIPILFGGYFVAVVAMDLTAGGFKSTVPRYIIPLTVGSQIAMAFMFVREIRSASLVRRIFSMLLAGCIVLAGLCSCLSYSQAKTWWVKWIDQDICLASYLNHDKDMPLWICARPETALTAAPWVRHDIPLMIVRGGRLVSSPKGYRRIFVSSGAESLIERIEAESGLIKQECPGTRFGCLLK